MKYSHLILDLDGTVYLDSFPIGDVIEQLNIFSSNGGKLFFLTNNTSTSRKYYYNKLKSLGLIDVYIENIITPICVAGRFLKIKHKSGYIVGTEAFKDELYKSFQIKSDLDNADYVLIAFDKELTYCKLENACKLINQGIPYYITHIDMSCPTSNGPIPDCGSISKLVASVTNKKYTENFGKPSKLMIEYIKGKISDVEKDDVLMVGDRIYTDMKLGNMLKINTLLVLSGESRYEDISESTKITHHARTLAEYLKEEL